MNRRKAILMAAALGLMAALPARAQVALDWVDTPPAGDALTKRLEDEATALLANDQKYRNLPKILPTLHEHTVVFDYFYPSAPRDYRALGGHGVLLLSVVAHFPQELPIKRAVLRFGGKDVVLQPLAERQSTVPEDSVLAKVVGMSREDVFFLLPGKLPRQTGDLWVFFSIPGLGLKVGTLSLVLPGTLNPDAPEIQPDPAATRKVLAREFPNLVRP